MKWALSMRKFLKELLTDACIGQISMKVEKWIAIGWIGFMNLKPKTSYWIDFIIFVDIWKHM